MDLNQEIHKLLEETKCTSVTKARKEQINSDLVDKYEQLHDMEQALVLLDYFESKLYFRQFYLLQGYLKIITVLLTVFSVEFLPEHSISQIFTVYQDIAISVLAKFFDEVLSFSGHNSIFYQIGDSFI